MMLQASAIDRRPSFMWELTEIMVTTSSTSSIRNTTTLRIDREDVIVELEHGQHTPMIASAFHRLLQVVHSK